MIGFDSGKFEDAIYFEKQRCENQLLTLTKFHFLNYKQQPKIFKIVLNFSFKIVNFNRKKVIPFFFIMELLAGQKCCSTKSTKNVLFLKLRKGVVTGCKVTLRKKNLYSFIDTLILALPRKDNFKGFSLATLKKNKTNVVSFLVTDLFTFYPAESRLNSNVKKMDVSFIFNFKSYEKKVFLLNLNSLPFF